MTSTERAPGTGRADPMAAHTGGRAVLLGYGAETRHHLEQVEHHNAATLDVVADLAYRVVTGGHRIHVSGSGHSVALVLEAFFRAGGLACVNPLYHPGLLPLHGGAESTLVERTSGLASLLAARAAPTSEDLAVIASNSGVNAFPVELAEELHRHGTPVVALMSVAHSSRAPARIGRKLGDVADHVLDTLVPYGDAAYPAGEATTAGLSSLVNVHLWNLLLVRLADRAAAAGEQLPIWTSANVEGGDERNRELRDRYRHAVPLL
jgi:uncharacterized phosphosugar-binding protein